VDPTFLGVNILKSAYGFESIPCTSVGRSFTQPYGFRQMFLPKNWWANSKVDERSPTSEPLRERDDNLILLVKAEEKSTYKGCISRPFDSIENILMGSVNILTDNK